MFYWDKNSSGFQLENQLQAVGGVEEIFVATAYLSNEGVDILQRLIDRDSVKRKNIVVCLSTEFSDDNPSDLLIRLGKITKVRIAKGGRLFHPKFYYIKGSVGSLLIFGSSNLTGGGFDKNIEFDRICSPTADEIVEVEKFIAYCLSQTDEVEVEHIDFYKSQEAKLAELKKVKSQIARELKSFDKKDDPFTEDTYDITNFYFNFVDYQTFFSRNIAATSATVTAQRKAIQDKLLRIHSVIVEQVNTLNLYVHWDKNNITSLTFPCKYNKYIVDWMGVRYGKRRDEICFGGDTKEAYESFTKHACLQCNVNPKGFEIVLFFAVPTDAWDRKHL